jgi:hypothetical protein
MLHLLLKVCAPRPTEGCSHRLAALYPLPTQQLSQKVELASSLSDRQSDFKQVLFVKEPQLGKKGSGRPKGWC